MQEWEWDQAHDKFPSGHLVSGYYERDGLDRLTQLRRFVASMGPKGQYACRAASEQGELKVDVLFELEADAKALGDPLKAKRGSSPPGYSTYRWFEYTPLKFRVIARTLAG